MHFIVSVNHLQLLYYVTTTNAVIGKNIDGVSLPSDTVLLAKCVLNLEQVCTFKNSKRVICKHSVIKDNIRLAERL